MLLPLVTCPATPPLSATVVHDQTTNSHPPALFAVPTQQLSNGTATLPVTLLAKPTMLPGTAAAAPRREALLPLPAASASDLARLCAPGTRIADGTYRPGIDIPQR